MYNGGHSNECFQEKQIVKNNYIIHKSYNFFIF